MATIDRRNILDLIGKHRGKYHSCILTCYNFDFSFFEERVLPVLRTSNIKNVNVFADGHFLEQAQEMTTGKEFMHNKTYSFLPVYMTGVFHPKIMLLTGVHHGLLIIGSGNITSSGVSTNDEIWGAFHLDNVANENAQLFAEVWSYLQTFTNHSLGFGTQKMDWIKKYSPWLLDLPMPTASVFLGSLKQHIQFISHLSTSSIYEQVISGLPKKGLDTITVISPYYDKKGSILEALIKDLRPRTFNCILDVHAGLLPQTLDPEIQKLISFYKWEDCKKDYNFENTRLHAKIFHFQYADGHEYLFLGSANATTAAMGTRNSKGANAEAGTLISRTNAKTNWLKELKIKIPAKRIDLDKYSAVTALRPEAIKRLKFKYRILYSEIKGNELTCYLKDPSDKVVSFEIVSREGTLVELVTAENNGKVQSAKITSPEKIFKISLVDLEGAKLSNYSIPHRVEALLRCNPDPAQEKLDLLMEREFPNGDGVTDLLQFISYDWADEEPTTSTSNHNRGTSRATVSDSRNQDHKYKNLSKEEFNKVSDDIVMRQSGYLNSANVRLADFLNFITSGQTLKDATFKESEEQKLLEDPDQLGEGQAVETKASNHLIAEKERRAIVKYFAQLDDLYFDMLEPVYEANALSVSPKDKITIKAISKILIALQLVHIFHGKRFTVATGDGNDEPLIERKYLPDGNVFDDIGSVKGFLCNVLGKFLILATAGNQQYDYAILNDKLKSYYWQVFEKALFIILNVEWKSEAERNYRLTLLLNLHYFLNLGTPASKEWCIEISKCIAELKKHNNYVSRFFEGNQEYYLNKFLPDYCRWSNVFKSERKGELLRATSTVAQGTVIFSSKIGFAFIRGISVNGSIKVDLERDGYEFNGTTYKIDGFVFTPKCVTYS